MGGILARLGMIGIWRVLSPDGPGLCGDAVGGAGVLLGSVLDLLRVCRPSFGAGVLRFGEGGASSSLSSSESLSAILLLWLFELTFMSIPLSAPLSLDVESVRLLRLVAVFRCDSMSVSDSDSSDDSLAPVHGDDTTISVGGRVMDWRVLAARDRRGEARSSSGSS